MNRAIDVRLKTGVLALLLLVVGVQLGIRHGRWLEAHEIQRLGGGRAVSPGLLGISLTGQRLRPPLSDPIQLTVTATAYSSTPEQTDGDPFITATGNRVGVGTLAVSRDLEALLPMGTRIFVVDDRMHRRWSRRIDFWLPDRGSALRFGRRELILRVWP